MEETRGEGKGFEGAAVDGGTLTTETTYSENDEEFPEGLQCPVCWDLLYKPVILACGHICCFWCTHHSMNSFGDSACAICRNSYNHFPNICQTFHFLIRKKFPTVYGRRQRQVLEEENKMSSFSPQFDETADCDNGVNSNGSAQKLSTDDALCGSCKLLLCRPVVLNCGHAFCQSCLVNMHSRTLFCDVCQSTHPGGIPKVCLEFNRFLEEEFPEAYIQRKEEVKQVVCMRGDSSACASQTENQVLKVASDDAEIEEKRLSIHFGVGCDTCGVVPIIGKRYKCKDCTEKIGFDMCEDCYNSKSKLPGRFNQQHKPEHTFILKQPPVFRYNLLSLRFLDDDPVEEGQGA